MSRRTIGVLLFLIAAAFDAVAGQPPPKLTAEQKEKLESRGKLLVEGDRRG